MCVCVFVSAAAAAVTSTTSIAVAVGSVGAFDSISFHLVGIFLPFCCYCVFVDGGQLLFPKCVPQRFGFPSTSKGKISVRELRE